MTRNTARAQSWRVAGETAIFQEHLLSPATVDGAIWPFDPRYWKPAHYHAQVEFMLVVRGRMQELACCLVLEDPSLDRSEICRTLDISESYLSRRFGQELGVAFVEQRARSRLARFCTHVSREKRNYLESALEAGFGSYSQLHRVFVQLVGLNPREYLLHGGRNRRADRCVRPRHE